jgi:hypothetical protein
VADDAGLRVALVIAVDTYLDEDLRQLRAPADDAATFGEVLGDPEFGGFDVTSLVNGNAHQVRLAIVEFLTECRPNDVALIYLSCHGLVDVRRRLYFAAIDTLKNRLPATGIEAHWLLDQLEECRARRQVVVLDCCFSGAFARGLKGDTDLDLGERFLGQGRGRVVLTASRGTEYSFEGSPIPGAAVPGSVFTNALVAGIRTGAADRDNDGYISVDDAYTYAFDEMRVSGAEQTPQRWLYGAEGSILLARNPSASATPLGPPSGPPVPVDDRPAVSARRRAQLSSSGIRVLVGGHRVVAACLAAAVGVVVVALLWGILHRAGNASGGGGSAGTPKSDVFRSSGPWSLRIDSNRVTEGIDGCLVTVTNTKTGESTNYPNGDHGPEYETSLWQMHEGGHFRWTVNDKSCVVIPDPGSYDAESSPFTPEFDHGDSEAFVAKGQVEVEVIDFLDETPPSRCRIYLADVATGETVDVKVATTENPVVMLDPSPPARCTCLTPRATSM